MAKKSDLIDLNDLDLSPTVATAQTKLQVFSETESLNTIMQEIGIRTDLGPEALFNLGVEFHNGAMELALKAGVAFMAAKQAITDSNVTESSNFKAWLVEMDISEQRAYEVIKLAKTYIALPAAKRKSYLQLGKSKAIKLSALDEEQMDALLTQNPDALDEFALMPRKTLVLELKKLQAKADTYENQRDDLQLTVNTLTRNQAPGDGEFNARTYEVRYESAALEYGARLYLDDLEVLLSQVLDETEDTQTQTLRLRSVGLAIGAAFARAQALYTLTKLALDEDMPVQPHSDLLLTDSEKDKLQAGLTIIRANAARTKGERLDEVIRQDNAHRKGGGRPRGSTNK